MARPLQQAIESLLASGRCPRIEVDLTEQGVVCPDAIRERCGARLVLDLAAGFTNELMLDELGIDVAVSVDGREGSELRIERCWIPWAAIRELIDRDAASSAAFRETATAGTALASTAEALHLAPTWTSGELIGLVHAATTMSVHEYRVLSRLGRGAFGIVDLVGLWNDDDDCSPAPKSSELGPRDRYAAVKSPQRDVNYSPTELERFFSEGTAWLALPPHRNVVTCQSVRWIDGLPRIFAEYVSGGSLADWIAEGRLSNVEIILGVAIELAQGVEHAHRHGVIHQDIKPANVLMTEDGVAMLTDFGLARVGRLVSGSRVGSTRSANGTATLAASLVGGTPGFCAPEVEWTGLVSRRSDIWSWAVTVLAMFAQAAPAPDERGDAWLERMLRDRPPFAHIPPERVLTLLRRCLSHDPDARPTTMTKVVETLEHAHHRLFRKSYGPRREPTRQIPVDDEHDRAIAWIELGRRDKAEAMLREFLIKHPQHTLAAYNLGLIELRAGLITGQQLIARLERYPSKIELPADITRVCIVAEQGNREEALRILNGIQDWHRKFGWVNEGGDELSGLQEEEHVHGWNLGRRPFVRVIRRPSSSEHFLELLQKRLSDGGPFVAPFLLSA